jgi:pimeloyl-ACP methyl ester carboxylesterase
VPGWGADWEYFVDLFDEVDEEVPLYFLESREKRSSTMAPDASYSMRRFARDVAVAIRALGLDATGYVLVGTCFGSGVLLETLSRKLANPAISVLFDPMPRLWVPRWILHWIVPVLPISLIAILRPSVRRALLYGMEEEAQRERTRKIIDSAVLPKWKPGSFQIRDWSAFDVAPRVTNEVHVLNAASDRFHDGSVYPVIAKLMPNATYVRFFVEGRDRERFMGTTVNAYSRSRGNSIPEELAKRALAVAPTSLAAEEALVVQQGDGTREANR